MITTSATTITTVRSRSIQELKNYKKQFQKFWIPFMEQFIPATTIWVAGEKWCNEPCPVINLCDLDYELVEGSVSIQTLKPPTNPIVPKNQTYDSVKPTENKSVMGFKNSGGVSEKVNDTPLITPLKDLGVTTTTPLLNDNNITNLYIESYRNRFSNITTETI